MADTNTAILALVKPDTAPGGSNDTWGTKWNSNFDDIDDLFEDSGGDPVLKQSKGGTGAKTASVALDNLGASAVGKALFTAETAEDAVNVLETEDRLALVFQGSSSSETDYEIGTIIKCTVVGGVEPARNAIVVPRFAVSSGTFTDGGTGTALSGTWRSRGAWRIDGGTDRHVMLQKVAD